MKTSKILLVALSCLLAGPVLAQSVGEKTGVNSVLGISPSTPDFVKQVAISDMFEIEQVGTRERQRGREGIRVAHGQGSYQDLDRIEGAGVQRQGKG